QGKNSQSGSGAPSTQGFGSCTGGSSTPAKPSSIGSPSTSVSGSYTVSWGASYGFSGGGLAKYYLEQSKNGGAYYSKGWTYSTVTSKAVSGLADGSYRYRVKACKADICSGWQTAGSSTLVRHRPSTAPAPTNINSTSSSYTINWSKPSGSVTYYNIQQKINSGSWSTISTKRTTTSLALSGKSNNTPYYYRVQACNTYSWACAGYGANNTVKVELKPGTPIAPSNINSTSTSYTVTWAKPSGTVSFYSVQERVAGGSWSTILSSTTATSVSRSGKSNNTNYEYRARACNSYTWACSGYGAANSIKVRLKPSTPAVPSRPSTSTGSAAISWVKPSGTVTYYNLQKRLNNAGSWYAGKYGDTNTSETLTGLTNGVWDFRVQACNQTSWACSSYSGVSADTTVRLKASTPSAPAPTTSTDTGSVTVSWSAASNATYYNIQSRNNLGSWITSASGATGTSKAISGFTDGSWDFRIQACNTYSWACSSWSADGSSVIWRKAASTPAAPAPTTSTDTNNVTVSWAAASNATYYHLQRRKNNGSWATAAANINGTSQSLSGFSDGSWDFRIKACNGYNWACSSYGVDGSSVTWRKAPSTPSAANPTTSTDTGSVTVSWAAVSSATYYNLQRRNNGGSWSTAASNITSTSQALSGFSDGSWDFRIQACNTYSWACSSYGFDGSLVVWRGIPSTPAAPSRPSTSTGSAAVSWVKPSGAVTYYTLLKRFNNAGNWSTTKVGALTSTNLTVTGLTDGLWDFKLQACNGSWACSSFSAVSSDTLVRLKPSIPIKPMLPASDIDGSYSVSWTLLGETDETGNYYDLTERKNNTGSFTTVADNTSGKVKSLTGRGDGFYDYQVRACNDYDWACSDYSEVSNDIHVLHVPGVPGSLTNATQDTDSSVAISWGTASGSVANYRLEEQKNNGSWALVNTGSTATSKTLTGRGNGSYQYRVRACNASGCGGYRTGVSTLIVRIKPATPAAPSGSSTSTGSASVSWASTTNGTYYDLQKRNNGGSWVAVLSGLSSTDSIVSGLTDGSWDYRVRACNQYSWSCSSFSADSANTTVRVKPSTPSKPAASTTQSTSGNYSISWTKPSGTVTVYDVEERKNNGGWTSVANDTGALTLSLSGRGTGDYDYHVRACNQYDWACSGYSAVSVDTLVRKVPATPSISAPTSNQSTTGEFELVWNGVSEATYYQLQKRVNSGTWTNLSANQSGTRFTTDETADGQYGYQVRACNGASWACSNYSAVKTINLKLPPEYARKSDDEVANAALMTPNVALQEAVGALEGQAGVSGGAATYNIPIALPPGRAGMQPNVSLNYSSRGGNGSVGVGWGLSAGSAIHRCGKMATLDGATLAVTYNSKSDRLCLDGQRLILLEGNYGASGAVYRTEIDTFARITQTGNLISTTGFTLEHKNGLISAYGSLPDSRHSAEDKNVTLTWAIARTIDRTIKQNNIIYNYQEFATGEHLLSAITYTGEGYDKGGNKVEFEYEDRTDTSFQYLAGGKTPQTKKLKYINTFNNAQQIRSYQLNYGATSAVSKRSVLRSVTECGYKASVEKCLPETSFDWQDVQPSLSNHSSFGLLSDVINGDLEFTDWIDYIDVDGDGRVELITYESVDPQNGLNREMNAHIHFIDQSGNVTSSIPFDNTIVQLQRQIDLNLDGTPDFVSVVYQPTPHIEITSYKNGQFEQQNLNIPYSTSDGAEFHDLNSDGLLDLVKNGVFYLNESTIVNGLPEVAFSSGQTNGFPNKSYQSSLAYTDIDGDGLLDVLKTNTPANSAITYQVYFAFFAEDGSLHYEVKNGDAIGLPSNARYNQGVFADINGDGLDDYVSAEEISAGNYGWGIRYNQGDGTFKTLDISSFNTGIHKWPATGSHRVVQARFKGLIPVDIDMDGKMELAIATEAVSSVTAWGRADDNSGYADDNTEWGPVKDDQLQIGGFYANGGYVDTTRFDVRDFKWSILDLDSGRVITDFVTAPLPSALGGGLQFADKDLDGKLEASHRGISSVCMGTDIPDSKCVGYRRIPSNAVPGHIRAVHTGGSGGGFRSLVIPSPDLIQESVNGLGITNRWDYAPISSNAERDSEDELDFYKMPPQDERYLFNDDSAYKLGISYFYFTSSMMAVSDFYQADGIGGEVKTRYGYREAIYNRRGRGFQGFRSIVVDGPSGIRSVTDFHQRFPLSGKIEEARTCLTDDAIQGICSNLPISKTHINYTYYQYKDDGGPTQPPGHEDGDEELPPMNPTTIVQSDPAQSDEPTHYLYWPLAIQTVSQTYSLKSRGALLSETSQIIDPDDVRAKTGDVLR
ncbi:MAG: fibronectin type III domain-containing protein, partial [Flavobacteriales bacterium]|nr:fibronectin type III domain-containing protein [Flavobacteriales bacterium]